jgi:hypothetical protein
MAYFFEGKSYGDNMNKIILVIGLLTLSFAASATTNEEMVKACKEAGVVRLTLQAKALKREVIIDSIQECEVDNRSESQSNYSYVWFCARVTDGTYLNDRAVFHHSDDTCN